MKNSFVYIGTGTAAGVFLSTLSSSGRLSEPQQVASCQQPGFLSLSAHTARLYTIHTRSELDDSPFGAVNAFRIDRATGALSFLNSQEMRGIKMTHTHLSPQADMLLAASYGGKRAFAYPLDSAGLIQPASSSFHFTHEGSGVNPERQAGSFPHSFYFNLEGTHAFLCDLGADRVFIYQRVGNKLLPHVQPFLELAPGAGPRHIARHPGGNVMYVLNELNASITVCAHQEGSLEIIQEIATLPTSVSAKNTAAEIFCSRDGNFVYCSNRAHGSEHDCITSYQVVDRGQLELLEFVSTDRHPRNFCLDPTENFVLVASRDSDNVAVYKRDTQTGRLERSEHSITLPQPICVRVLEAS